MKYTYFSFCLRPDGERFYTETSLTKDELSRIAYIYLGQALEKETCEGVFIKLLAK